MAMIPVGIEIKNHCAGEGSSNVTARLSQLRVAVVGSGKLVPDAGNSSGTQRKGNVRR
jgi:hypothetical protein